jgi:hypothetical protein
MKDITVLDKNEWYQHLDTYLNNYNNTYHSIIKTTPNKGIDEIEKVAERIKKNANKTSKN